MSSPFASSGVACCGETIDMPTTSSSSLSVALNNHHHHHHHNQSNNNNYLDTTEADLVNELNKLTFEERERVLEDIHGVADVQHETPELVEKWCQQLDDALKDVYPRGHVQRAAFDRAVWLRPSLKTDTKFKLLFLRAENPHQKEQQQQQQHARNAAVRMCKYFTLKLELFGDEKLAKKLTLEDLEENTMKLMHKCPIVPLPHPDQAGRPTFYFNIQKFDWNDFQSLGQLSWYLIATTMIENEQAQLKGLSEVASVSMTNKNNNNTKINQSSNNNDNNHHSGEFRPLVMRSFVQKCGTIISALPYQLTSVHICVDSPEDRLAHWLIPLFRTMLGKHGRLRTRIHCGSEVELKYALLSFGIDFSCAASSLNPKEEEQQQLKHDNTSNTNSSSSSSSGEQQQQQHLQQLVEEFLEKRREIEEREKEEEELEEKRAGIVLYPKKHDVLMGRGRPFRDYPGNQRWSSLIEDNLERYQRCSDKFSKTCLSLEVVQKVQESGGRFIQQTANGEGWKILDAAVARDKTLRAFRPRISKNNGGGGNEGVPSDTSFQSPAKRIKRDPMLPG